MWVCLSVCDHMEHGADYAAKKCKMRQTKKITQCREQINQQTIERTHEWMDKWTDEQKDEGLKKAKISLEIFVWCCSITLSVLLHPIVLIIYGYRFLFAFIDISLYIFYVGERMNSWLKSKLCCQILHGGPKTNQTKEPDL